jgi:ribosome-associated translation inhibitor RaiA
MHIELKLHQVKPEQLLKAYLERMLSFGLSRFNERMGGVTARISGSESKGPVLMLCRLNAELRPFGTISAEATDVDVYAAIDRAASRLARRCESRCARQWSTRSSRTSIRTSRFLTAA